MTLISAAREYEIEFIYAISPGLDITFSNPKEVSTLKRKLDQVISFLFHYFSLSQHMKLKCFWVAFMIQKENQIHSTSLFLYRFLLSVQTFYF